MSYVPAHDRPPHFGNIPALAGRSHPSPTQRYASPDVDPSFPLRDGMAGLPDDGGDSPSYQPNDGYQPRQTAYQSHNRESNGSESRKRPRTEEDLPHPAAYTPGPGRHRPIQGSFFGMTARNPVTRTIGEFLLEMCRGRSDVEVEIKLGLITAPAEMGQRWKRISLPAMTELILPPDFRVGPFRSDMTQAQHTSLNQLLNETCQNSDPSKFRPDPSDPTRVPYPIRFSRVKQTDTFYNSPGNSKIRVSVDDKGNMVACIKKKKVADLNVANGREALDFRVSVSTEETCERPEGTASMSRYKDRACYKHQLVQVDLTYVKQMNNGAKVESYELEIEVIDVPGLIAEGLKEERGEPNQYDEMITSILDSARILIRNIVR